MTGYDYGNARLRARRAALLRDEDYAALLGRDLPGLLAALAATCFRAQAEATAGSADRGLGALYRVTNDHLGAALADTPGFYRGRAGDVVTALFGRFDVHNVVVLLRAAHHRRTEGAAGNALMLVSMLDARTAGEAAAQPDLPAAARLLAGRRLPDPDSAVVLLAAARRYEVDASLAAVEHAVASAARAQQLRVLTAAGTAAEPVTAAHRRETDDLNLLLALRLREAANGQATGSTGSPYLPGGTVPDGLLTAIRRAPARADVLAATGTGPGRWNFPLAAWTEGGDLATLEVRLQTRRLGAELSMLGRADPLSAAPVLHHVLAHLAQARNIRLLAQAAAGAIGHDTAGQHLIPPV